MVSRATELWELQTGREIGPEERSIIQCWTKGRWFVLVLSCGVVPWSFLGAGTSLRGHEVGVGVACNETLSRVRQEPSALRWNSKKLPL